MTTAKATPEVSCFVLEATPGDPEPLLAMRAVWPDANQFVFVFLSKFSPEWKASYALWADLKDGLAPFDHTQVDETTFDVMLRDRGVVAPSTAQWQAMREGPDLMRVPAGDVGKGLSPDLER